ncbi:hypothetical protein SAMN05192550_1142 [Flavobacterium glycines]|uniref:Lipoprotein n=1 Tax=Flavobacterium glycines TaxID=551990 RepID=A0A1B9DRQ8_9FLAO|nr:hypothetical protein [Flavobacterium glycines]OCB72369.1 hypothetical protein FBGL_06865 [Flavobacterium glycines]GEL09843.1 hypothetical protein FGL01_05820 [Flavobacterium glycines]SDI91535.1 hypothetical protein SAMN05192550_1142 [Flavobacterium glycines]
MKKVFLSLAVVAVLSVVSCKKAEEAPVEAAADTTAVAVDSAAVTADTAAVAVDSAAAPAAEAPAAEAAPAK